MIGSIRNLLNNALPVSRSYRKYSLRLKARGFHHPRIPEGDTKRILPLSAPSKKLRYGRDIKNPVLIPLLLLEVLHRDKVFKNHESRKKVKASQRDAFEN